MGVPKHHKDSARTKSSAKYRQLGRREINKAEKQKKIAEGKKIKSRKTPKTKDMIWDTVIRNIKPIGLIGNKKKAKLNKEDGRELRKHES